jgi:hypothetical protein
MSRLEYNIGLLLIWIAGLGLIFCIVMLGDLRQQEIKETSRSEVRATQ